MSENVPDSFDAQQPDLPTLAVDPEPSEADGVDTTRSDLEPEQQQ